MKTDVSGKNTARACSSTPRRLPSLRTRRRLLRWRKDASMADRDQARDIKPGDPVCPVCVKPIAKNDRVSGHGENLMHEACDYAARRDGQVRQDSRTRRPPLERSG